LRIALASVMPLGGRAICLIFRSASAIIRLTAFSLTRDWTIYLFFFCRSRILMPLFAAMHPVFEGKEHIWLLVFLQGVRELGKKQPYPT